MKPPGSKKIVFCHGLDAGGVSTFYENLRKALAPHGYQLLRLGWLGWSAEPVPEDSDFILLNPGPGDDLPRRVRDLVRWVRDNDIQAVMVNNYNTTELTALPYLPPAVARIVVLHSLWRRTYWRVQAFLEYLDAIVVLTQRQQHILVKDYKVPAEKIRIIPHGLDLSRLGGGIGDGELKPPLVPGHPVSLLYLGRLEEGQKAVLQLPRIVWYLKKWGIPFLLSVIGDGPDRQRLERKFAKLGVAPDVKMLGAIPMEGVHELLAGKNYDIFLMPSRWEVQPFSLIEGMAAGLVPVVSLIDGITDPIISQGETGFLCPIDNPWAFANAVSKLVKEPELISRIGRAAQDRARRQFSLEAMGSCYGRLLAEVTTMPPRPVQDMESAKIKLHPAFRATWRTFLPDSLKMWIRLKVYQITGYEF
jgi:glycosyltransferase involved in cell wall biosynthesis